MCFSLIASRPMELSWEPVSNAIVESQWVVDQYSREPDWLKLEIHREQSDLRTSIRLDALAGRGVVHKKNTCKLHREFHHTRSNMFFF